MQYSKANLHEVNAKGWDVASVKEWLSESE
jgi:hypothetical protein